MQTIEIHSTFVALVYVIKILWSFLNQAYRSVGRFLKIAFVAKSVVCVCVRVPAP